MLLISSIGVFMVMTMGGLDFSQGSMLGVASIVVCYLSHYNMVLAALGGVVTGGLIGLINGYFNVKRKITSFIVTICTMYLFRGVCAYATTNSPVYAVSDISKYNTLPFMLTFTVIIFVVAYLVFTYTGLGSRLKAIGFRCCLISNNQKPRVEMFNKDIQVDYVYNAHKPSTRNYLRAMEIMGTDRRSSVFIGDQLFTDVWGAKTCRNPEYSGKTDTSKGRNPDCFEALSGKIVLHFYV